MFLSCSKQQTLCEHWNCLLNQMYSVERMPTCVPSECSLSCLTTSRIYLFKWICCSQIFTLRYYLSWLSFVSLRCKKKVPATKRFTVHRTSNVLTLSLKRFANFSGGKITKVNRGISHCLPFWSAVSFLCELMFLSSVFLRMLVTQNSWTSDPTCLRAQATPLCMASMLFWCTLATVVTLAIITAMSR